MTPPCPIAGSAARQHQSVGMSERRISASISSGVKRSKGFMRIAPPTLLMRMSSRPWASSAAWTAASAPVQVSRSASTAVPCAASAASVTSWRAVDEDHPAALGGEAQRDGAADPLCRAGDEGDLAGEPAGEDGGGSRDAGGSGHRLNPPASARPARRPRTSRSRSWPASRPGRPASRAPRRPSAADRTGRRRSRRRSAAPPPGGR